MIEQVLEQLFTEVRTTQRSYTDLGTIPSKEGESTSVRISARQYGKWGWEDKTTKGIIEKMVLDEILLDIFGDPYPNRIEGVLLWRVKPEWAYDTDFATGRDRHKLYVRLGWKIGRNIS